MGYELCQKIIDLIGSLGYGVFFVDGTSLATKAQRLQFLFFGPLCG